MRLKKSYRRRSKRSKKRRSNKMISKKRRSKSRRRSKKQMSKRRSKSKYLNDGISRKFLALLSIIGNLWISAGNRISGPTNIDVAINKDKEKIIILASDVHDSREGMCRGGEKYSIENFIIQLNKVLNKRIDYFLEEVSEYDRVNKYFLELYIRSIRNKPMPYDVEYEELPPLQYEHFRTDKLRYLQIEDLLKNTSSNLKSVQVTNIVHKPDIRNPIIIDDLVKFVSNPENTYKNIPFDIIKSFSENEYNLLKSFISKEKFVEYYINNKVFLKIKDNPRWKEMYKEYIEYIYDICLKKIEEIFNTDAKVILLDIENSLENMDFSFNKEKLIVLIVHATSLELDMNSLIINDNLESNVSFFYFGGYHIDNIKYFLTKIYPKYNDDSWTIIENLKKKKYGDRCISTFNIFNTIKNDKSDLF